MDHVTIFLLGLCSDVIFELLFPIFAGFPETGISKSNSRRGPINLLSWIKHVL
jgi:hypothetical protein